MRSYHDDLVMAMAIGCWVRDTALEIDRKDMAYKRALLDSMIMSKSTIQTTIPGMQGHRGSKFQDRATEFKKEQAKYSWLYKG